MTGTSGHTLLFTWELGGNFGHLAKQLLIGRELRRRGHRCLFAVRDAAVAETLLAADAFEFVQAPYHASAVEPPHGLASYSDILFMNGFSSPELLSGLVAAWCELFGRFAPDAIVVEYSPTAVLAAKLAGIPLVRIDTGFGHPPPEKPFPSFRPWLGIPAEDVLAFEGTLLSVVNEVCGRYAHSPFASLQQTLATDSDLLSTAPELDHYPGRRYGLYVGPLFNLTDGAEIEWPAGPGSRILVYLRPFDGLEAVLKALNEAPAVVIAVIPGIDAALAGRFAHDRFIIRDRPVRMSGVLPDAALVISHGGHGLASACLQFGIPMLLIPYMIEQLMTVNNFERLGTGIGVAHDQVGTGFAAALERLLSEQGFRENARALSAKYEFYDQEPVICNLADTIEGTVRRKGALSLACRSGYSLPLSTLPGAPPEIVRPVPNKNVVTAVPSLVSECTEECASPP